MSLVHALLLFVCISLTAGLNLKKLPATAGSVVGSHSSVATAVNHVVASSAAAHSQAATTVHAAAGANVKAADAANAFRQAALTADCPLEDHLFGMTAEMKEAMRQEMYANPLATAVNFIKTNANIGYTWCASLGQYCNCAGLVRFGSYNGGWPLFTQPLPTQGSLQCAPTSFPDTVAVQDGLRCECSSDTEKGWQNLKLRYNSVSYLQESWITLTRVLAQANLLPLNGDRLWQGENHFSLRGGGSLDRYWMDIFLEEAKLQHVGMQGPNICLEWAPVFYMPKYPGCVSGRQLSLEYTPDVASMRVEGNTVYSDNVHLPMVLGEVQVDLALSTNVWEHESEPFAAIQALHANMKPGGILVFTVPFFAPFHGVPYDFYRYTKSGVLHVLEGAGFCVPRASMASGGDYIFNMALMAGVAPGDFSDAELRASFHRGYDSIGDGAMNIMAIAVKKLVPTDACPP